MKKILFIFLLMGHFTWVIGQQQPDLQRFTAEAPKMGSLFRLVMYAPDSLVAKQAADSAFRRVDVLNAIMSDYWPQSELNELCATAGTGEWVVISNDLWAILNRAVAASRLSGGAFDATVGPLVQIWRTARKIKQMPPDSVLMAAKASVGYQWLSFDAKEQAVRLEKPDMQLDLGGIAKGYAGDEMLKVLRQFGIRSALVDAGGDLTLGEAPPDRNGWRVAIQTGAPEEKPTFLELKQCAVATSGDLYQFVELDGQRYSHLVDPQTGKGLTNRTAVTAIAIDGTTADWMASAVSVMGATKGLAFAQKIAGSEVFIQEIEKDKTNTYATKGLKKKLRSSAQSKSR